MLDRLLTFHQTVQGYNHIVHRNPITQEIEPIDCEDASLSFSDYESGFHIIAVADGHGDPACTRSKVGSQLAVKIATECLKQFAEVASYSERWQSNSFLEQLNYKRTQRSVITQLTNSIISKWYDAIYNDLNTNVPTEQELQVARDTHKEHMYGTTLMAALWINNYLIMIHQGDGRCDVIYDDGTVDQPIPWDNRCVGTTTTSMCNSDVVSSIRHCVIDTRKKQVIACFMGSDGVEDSYRNNEESQQGTHKFYRELSCKISDIGSDSLAIEDYLAELLPSFSQTGSGDDVSVAGIVDVAALKKWYKSFEEQNRRYDLNDQLIQNKNKLISMERKYGILKERAATAKRNLEAITQRRESLKVQLSEWCRNVSQQEQIFQSIQRDYNDFQQMPYAPNNPSNDMIEQFVSMLDRWIDPLNDGNIIAQVIISWVQRINNSKLWMIQKRIESKYNKSLETVENSRRVRDQIQQDLSQCDTEYQKALADENVARLEYEDYHERYSSIERACASIQEEINRPISLECEPKSVNEEFELSATDDSDDRIISVSDETLSENNADHGKCLEEVCSENNIADERTENIAGSDMITAEAPEEVRSENDNTNEQAEKIIENNVITKDVPEENKATAPNENAELNVDNEPSKEVDDTADILCSTGESDIGSSLDEHPI